MKNLNYKICKELKDAGFSQREQEWSKYISSDEDHKQCWGWNRIPTDVYCPDLLELIEACGDGFIELEFKNGSKDWVARGGTDLTFLGKEQIKPGINDFQYAEWGKSPEEAVAKLWLKLNDNKDTK